MLDQQKLRTFIPSGSKYTRYTVVSAVSYMNIFVSKIEMCFLCVQAFQSSMGSSQNYLPH